MPIQEFYVIIQSPFLEFQINSYGKTNYALVHLDKSLVQLQVDGACTSRTSGELGGEQIEF